MAEKKKSGSNSSNMKVKKTQRSSIPKHRRSKLLPSNSFVTLKYKVSLPRPKYLPSPPSDEPDATVERAKGEEQSEEATMQTRRAWNKNLANPNRTGASLAPETVPQTPVPTHEASTNGDSPGTPGTGHVAGSPIPGFSKPQLAPKRQAKRKRSPAKPQSSKRVKFNVQPNETHFLPPVTSPSSSEDTELSGSNTSADEQSDNTMAARPQLKLKLTTPAIPQTHQIAQSPAPQSATRTPSLKLKIGTPFGKPALKQEQATPTGDVFVKPAKKRKSQALEENGVDSADTPPAKRPMLPKLTFKRMSMDIATPATATTQILKLKSKGKVPKRPLGVGYDSELDERENDPVILEGFILRMLPGPDAEYVQEAISKGTIGVHRAQGGADIRFRPLDLQGRRSVMFVRSNQYACVLVDLPCVVEGMKSWDKKDWIKSMDVSQMMIVLGPCKSDEEARNYSLPSDIDSKNYQYGHGLTAPMKWVRKRRFARTKRTRVDDIEAVERRVAQLIEADERATSTSFQLLDHDPRDDEEEEDEDAYGEDEDEADGYFPTMDTPAISTPMEIQQEDVDEFERALMEDAEIEAPLANGTTAHTHSNLEAGDSSFAITSASATPTATAAQTPASAADQTSEDEDEVVEDEDEDEAEKEGDEEQKQKMDRIADMDQKIAELDEQIKATANAIIRRKLMKKKEELEDDRTVMKKSAGLVDDDDE